MMLKYFAAPGILVMIYLPPALVIRLFAFGTLTVMLLQLILQECLQSPKF
jgi:hypothetical protein